jgi:hypothetical protein
MRMLNHRQTEDSTYWQKVGNARRQALAALVVLHVCVSVCLLDKGDKGGWIALTYHVFHLHMYPVFHPHFYPQLSFISTSRLIVG